LKKGTELFSCCNLFFSWCFLFVLLGTLLTCLDMDLQDPFIKNYAEQKVGMVSIYRVNGEISVSRSFGDPDYKMGHCFPDLDKYFWGWPKDHSHAFTNDLIIAT
jgi:hypothetical protein|tara:strand:+ start:733 stop:1044 length:312 start_codon:yes stop_codon:yes gene_type:complete